MKKKVHKKVVIDEEGREHVIIVEDTHIRTAESGHEPQELQDSVATIVEQFLDQKGDFSPTQP